MQSLRFLVSGKVQGVYYRKFVSDALRRLGVQGYVRNLPDGRVEAVARLYDEEEELPRILEILHRGSPLSEVEQVEYERLDEDDLLYDGFEIRY